MPVTIDKLVHLSDVDANRLERMAHDSGTTEDALISKALTLLFGFNDPGDEESERKDWSALGLQSMERVWDNAADAVYDNWRELYGV